MSQEIVHTSLKCRKRWCTHHCDVARDYSFVNGFSPVHWAASLDVFPRLLRCVARRFSPFVALRRSTFCPVCCAATLDVLPRSLGCAARRFAPFTGLRRSTFCPVHWAASLDVASANSVFTRPRSVGEVSLLRCDWDALITQSDVISQVFIHICKLAAIRV